MSVFVIVTCFLWISWGACIIRFMVTKRFFAGPPWPVCLEYLEILAVQLVSCIFACGCRSANLSLVFTVVETPLLRGGLIPLSISNKR